jgi:hypothetical protein
MNLNFFKKKSSEIFKEFVTKSFAESVKIGLSALAIVVTNSTPVGAIIGAGAKGITDKLLSKSSDIDKKIEKLLREPLLTGIKHLHDAFLCEVVDSETQRGRDNLLHEAHVSLTKAWSLMTDSIDDSIFILALDSVALAAHTNYKKPAEDSIKKLEFYLQDKKIKIVALETEANDIVEEAQAWRRFLYTDPHGSKPAGIAEQKLLYKQLKKKADKIDQKAKIARNKFDILTDLYSFAKRIFELSSSNSFSSTSYL